MQDDLEGGYPIPPEKIGKAITQLSSNQHYVLIYPRKDMLTGKFQNNFKAQNLNPYLLVFEDQENATGLDIKRQYLKENNLAFNDMHVYLQEYRTQFFLNNDMNLSTLKWNLEDDSIDGYCFLISITEMYFNPEATMHQMIGFENKLRKQASIAFFIPQNRSYFYIKKDPNDTIKTFGNKVVNQLKKTHKVAVKIEKIRLTFMFNKKQTTVNQYNFKKLTNKDYVYVNFVDKVDLPKQNAVNVMQFIVFQSIDNEQIKLPYNQVRVMRVDTILDQQLNFKEKRLNSSEYGLRIHDIIIKPFELLSDYPEIQQNLMSDSKYVKVVLAFVVKQSFIFYAHVEEMDELNCPKNKNKFQAILDKSEGNKSHRRACEEVIRDRAKTAKVSAFKKEQNIEPILYYTSQLKVLERKTPLKLYNAYNTFLRNLKFGSVDSKQYEKWQYLFTRSIVKALKLIDSYKGDLYRGISHTESYKIGKTIEFKQFNSCSPNKNVALCFAGKAIYVMKNCRFGRKIRQYSFFQVEEEVLNVPYSEYRIIDIQRIKHEGKDLEQVTMEEVFTPDWNFDLNDQPLLFVLWVDGEEGEGVGFSQNIRQIRQSTSFIHLSSTKELENWLKSNKQMLKDRTISTVLITNMTRTENGLENGIAGVQAIKVYREHQPQGKVMLYIGNIDAAKDKLTKNQIASNTVTIGNTEFALLQFFANICGIS